MEIYQNIAEYYDELFPVTDDQKKFYQKLTKSFAAPVRYLRIGCGTGLFEHFLAREGADVTGIETAEELLNAASERYRTQLMALRFFNMSSLEMVRYLGKKFYHIISILDDRIIFTHDKILQQKLLYDCHELLHENGYLIIKFPNFNKFSQKEKFSLPVRETVRSKLNSTISAEGDKFYMNQILYTGNSKKVSVTEDAPVFLLTKEQLEENIKKAGFTRVEFFAGFDESQLSENSDSILAVIS